MAGDHPLQGSQLFHSAWLGMQSLLGTDAVDPDPSHAERCEEGGTMASHETSPVPSTTTLQTTPIQGRRRTRA